MCGSAARPYLLDCVQSPDFSRLPTSAPWDPTRDAMHRLLQWHAALAAKHNLPAETTAALQEASKAAGAATKKAFKKMLKVAE